MLHFLIIIFKQRIKKCYIIDNQINVNKKGSESDLSAQFI